MRQVTCVCCGWTETVVRTPGHNGGGRRPNYCSVCRSKRTAFNAWKRGKGPHPLRWDVAYRTCEWCWRGYTCHDNVQGRKRRFCSSACQQAWNAMLPTCALASCQRCGVRLPGPAHGSRFCQPCRDIKLAARLEYEAQRRHLPHRRAKSDRNRVLRQRADADGFQASGVKVTAEYLIDRDGLACWICGEDVEPDQSGRRRGPSIDHIVPVTEGGITTPENCRLAHHRCNAMRGTGTPDEATQLALSI